MTLSRRSSLALGPLLCALAWTQIASAQPGLAPQPAPPPPARTAPPPARAALPPAPFPPPPMQPRVERYGWQIFVLDMAGLLSLAAVPEGETFGLTYMFGGAAVHAAHGNGIKALQSIGVRLAGPFAGALGGLLVADCEQTLDDYCPLGYVAAGILVGMSAAAAFDWFFLAREVTYEPSRPAALFRVGSLRANPDLRITRRGSATLGLAGSF